MMCCPALACSARCWCRAWHDISSHDRSWYGIGFLLSLLLLSVCCSFPLFSFFLCTCVGCYYSCLMCTKQIFLTVLIGLVLYSIILLFVLALSSPILSDNAKLFNPRRLTCVVRSYTEHTVPAKVLPLLLLLPW